MKVNVANITLDGRIAGPQNQIILVAACLKGQGIETTVFIPRKDSEDVYSRLMERNIRVRRLPLHHLTTDKSHLIGYALFFLPELFSLAWHLRREKIAVVHCNGAWQIKGVIAGKIAGAKVIWHVQDTCMPWAVRTLFKMLAHSLCDGLMFSGKRAKDYYLSGNGLGAKRIAEIQAPVDTSHFDPDHVLPDPRMADTPGMKISTVGYINPVKGIEYFIEMARILTAQYGNLRFFIVGPELESQRTYSREVTRLAAKYRLDNVSFYGACDDVPRVLKASDIYVCSSVTEASPMSVWEAMAMRKAIVSTDVGDVGRFIEDGENGFIVPPRDPEALAEKVGILIEDGELRASFGERARAVAVRELDVEICALRQGDFYREVFGGRS
jgi:glycosyltransferase involved in cell wall biosynthesis